MTGSSTEALMPAFLQVAPPGSGEASWLADLRRDAFARFTSLGLPTRADEEWKYTSLRGFNDAPWTLSRGQSNFTCDSLPAGVRISALADVLTQRPDIVRPFLARQTASLRAFEAANAAFVGTGLVIEIDKGVEVKQAIRVCHTAQGGAFFPRLLIIMAADARALVIESYDSHDSSARAFTGSVTEISLGENAALTYTKVQIDAPLAYHVSSTRAVVPRAAHLASTSVTIGGLVTRNDLDVELTGEGAQASVDGFYLVTGKRHVDNHTSIDHTKPHTTSSQLYKGILGGQGRGVFNGKVLVRRDAQQTKAYQLNQNLLLSPDAEIDTKPQLEIDADDVKCSHGAAIGQLNADEVFYLQSRGIQRAEAERLLSLGFADEVLFRISDPALREQLRRHVKDALIS